MNQKAAMAIIGLFALACIGAVVWAQEVHSSPSLNTVDTPKAVSAKPLQKPVHVPTEASSTDTGRIMSVESYIATHIGDFTSVKAKLSSSYQVDKVVAHDGTGVIYYHDGAEAHVADFTYSTDDFGAVSVDTFTVVQ